MGCYETLSKNCNMLEISTYYRFIIRIGSHSHDSAETDMRILGYRIQNLGNLVFSKAMFGLLGSEMEFEKHSYNFIVDTSPLLNIFQEME